MWNVTQAITDYKAPLHVCERGTLLQDTQNDWIKAENNMSEGNITPNSPHQILFAVNMKESDNSDNAAIV